MDCIARWGSGEHLGRVRIKYLEELGEVDVAYRLMPAYWDRGLATEAAIASVQFGFDRLGLKRLAGLVMPENVASIRVLEKAGLRYAATVAFLGKQFSKYIITT